MSTQSKDRLYKVGGRASVILSTALFASPFILVALYFIEQAVR